MAQFQALGGLTFSDTYLARRLPHGFFHLQPALRHRMGASGFLGGFTVLRGGFGIFVSPIGIANTTSLNQEGFSQTTQMAVTSNNYLLARQITLADPFPNGDSKCRPELRRAPARSSASR